jgi:uncharacterized membrane protein YeaQ/YmgE (transglycosylase-associated protein family)
MKNCLMLVVVGVALLGLYGCVAGTVLMKNDKGDIARCEAGAAAAIVGGYIGTKYQVNSCVEQYEAAGYKRVQ